jgi:prevent-host-death family protein
MSYVSVAEASRNLSHWVNQASYGRSCIIVTSRGKPKAVIMGVEAFKTLIGVPDVPEDELMSAEQFRKEFGEALAEAGYRTREEIIELVREVKREIAAERLQGVERSE